MPAIKTGDGPSLSGALRRLGVFRQARMAASVLALAISLGLVIASSPAAAEEGAGDVAAAPPQPPATHLPKSKLANFDGAHAPDDVRQLADWIVTSGDNHGMSFVIVEKPQAEVFVFDAGGKILGTAPCLIGVQPGDDSAPGIGTMTLAHITPEMRTTPAGRFVSSLGPDLGKKDVLWVDYADAISLHRVVNNVRSERRLERLASPTPLDHRISWGCINVPAKFFDRVVEPAFTGTSGVVYILPEIKSMQQVFPAYYDVDAHSGLQDVSLPTSAP
jgi:hypothetical protein